MLKSDIWCTKYLFCKNKILRSQYMFHWNIWSKQPHAICWSVPQRKPVELLFLAVFSVYWNVHLQWICSRPNINDTTMNEISELYQLSSSHKYNINNKLHKNLVWMLKNVGGRLGIHILSKVEITSLPSPNIWNFLKKPFLWPFHYWSSNEDYQP